MKLEVGKLYSCEEYFLIFYPDKDTVADAFAMAADPADLGRGARAAARVAHYWTRRFGKPVSSLPKRIPLLVLNTEKNFVEVLGGERKGWIIYNDWLNIKEIE
jgi:hypothetical protein